MSLCSLAAYGQTLDELEAKGKDRPTSFDRILAAERATRNGVYKLIDSDALKTASDFRRAGSLLMGANERKEETVGTGYELLLTALALGDRQAARSLGTVWDNFLMATGRYRRIGVAKLPMRIERGDSWWLEPAPQALRDIYLDPEGAVKRANAATDNPEVQQIVDADQKVRQDWSKLTAADMRKMARDDRKRFHRIKEILDQGGIRTAKDFENAALVCQHGEVFLDYALAHELCVCAMMLGSRTASWLAGASYDRMLLSASYPQIFATQYFGDWKLQQFSTTGVNDRMRTAVVHLTLAQSQDREKHPPKG